MSGRDELLERLLTGELDPQGAEARTALEADAELRERYEAARGTLDLLEAAGEDRRSLADDVRAAGAVPGEEHVDAFVRARTALRPRTSPRWRHVLAAAVAILIVAFVVTTELWHGPTTHLDTPPDDGRTLGGTIHDLEPAGEVKEYDRFTWTGELSPGGYWVVTVRAADGSDFEIESAHLTEPVWEPADTASWPDAIEWTVVAYDVYSQPGDSRPQRAHLSAQ